MVLTGAERAKRHIEKLKAEGKFDSFKTKRASIEKKCRENNKKKLCNLPLPEFVEKIDDIRKKVKERVRKHRENRAKQTSSNISSAVNSTDSIRAVKKCDKVRGKGAKRKQALQKYLEKCDKVRQQTRNRVRKYRQQLKEKCNSGESSTYTTKSSRRKAISRAQQGLPKSLEKRKEIVKDVYEKYFGVQKQRVPVKRSSGLDETVKNDVIEFYERPDISQQAPGRKDFVNIKDKSGNKIQVQKKYLMFSIDEVYDKFCKETGAVQVHRSKFYQLRPKHIIPASKTPPNVCLCIYHSNFNYAIDAFNKAIPEMPRHCDRDNFYQTFFCEKMTENCYFGNCKSCKGVFADTILGVASCNKNVKLKWQVWKKVDNRWQNLQEVGTLETLANYIVDLASHFYRHHYINKVQLEAYQRCVSNVKNDNSAAVIQIDFAENYKCVFQDEAANAHWNQSQVSLFTAAIWTGDNMNSYSVVTDDLDHSKRTIVPYVDKLFEQLPKGIRSVHIWSDGPSSQFKNKFIAKAISVLEEKHKMTICWSFFAASHGKGPTDGTGGALKNQVWTAVKTRKAIVCNASDFSQTVKEGSKVQVTFRFR